MAVVGHQVAGLAHHREQDAFRGAPLVCGNDVLEAHHVPHGILKTIEGGTSGIGFVAAHDARPLRAAHGSRTTVAEQIDDDVL